jgi:hypothetical protein
MVFELRQAKSNLHKYRGHLKEGEDARCQHCALQEYTWRNDGPFSAMNLLNNKDNWYKYEILPNLGV